MQTHKKPRIFDTHLLKYDILISLVCLDQYANASTSIPVTQIVRNSQVEMQSKVMISPIVLNI